MNTCRICYDGAHKKNSLVTPCACKGSIGFIHQKCLRDWVRVSSSPYCELCKFPYVIEDLILETLHEPSFILLWISKHSIVLYFNLLAAYMLYLLYTPTDGLTRWHGIVTNVINFMPYNLLIVAESQGFVLVPAIMVIKQKYLYLQYLFSCRRLPTMRISAVTYLTVIIIGFISSFYYIASSFIVAIFLGHIYQIHSKIILQMNTDRLKKSIWLLE
jgi:hypothetical protein